MKTLLGIAASLLVFMLVLNLPVVRIVVADSNNVNEDGGDGGDGGPDNSVPQAPSPDVVTVEANIIIWLIFALLDLMGFDVGF